MSPGGGMVDTRDLKSLAQGREGSIPSPDTKKEIICIFIITDSKDFHLKFIR
jgi:hypothetical protein